MVGTAPFQSTRRRNPTGSNLRPAHGAIHSDRRRTQALGAGMSTSSSKHNLAARMAHWSGRHRKKAFWGWLAFVFVVFAAGNMVGTTNISDVDQFSGESHRAEVALDRAGLRPVKDATNRLSGMQYVRAVESPLSGGGSVSADRHAALVDFQIAGDSTQAQD